MESPLRIAKEGGKPLPRKIRFTREALAGIAPPTDKDEIVIHDTEAKGLVCRIKRSGTRAFYWYGRVRGESRPVKRLIGGDEFPIEKLRDIARQTLVEARQGINPNAELRAKREADRNRQTVADLWETYKAKVLYRVVDATTTKTRATNESLWKVWISTLADRTIESITPDVVKAFHETVAAGKADPDTGRRLGGKRTANKCVVLLKAIFNASKLDNPARGVRLFKQHTRDRYLSPDEMRRFFDALKDEHDQTAKDFIEIALYTGQRRANVQSMEWSEIKLHDATWRIPPAKAKAKKPIDVPLTEPAMQILIARRDANAMRPKPSRFVFWSDIAKGGYFTEPRYAMQRICKAAGITDMTIHDLRRTMGSWQTARGANEAIVGKSLGHAAGSKATAIYSRLDLSPVRNSMTSAVDAMMIAAGRKAAPVESKPKAKGGKAKQPKK